MSRSVGLTLLALLCAVACSAHDSPIHVVEALTERIAREGASARLLTRRGDEHRALGDPLAALDDYQAALRLTDGEPAALLGLTRCRLALDEPRVAWKLAERGAAATTGTRWEHVFSALAAEAAEASGDDQAALTFWRDALAAGRPEIDWELRHAALLQRLGRDRDARDALAAAVERNPSVALRRAWIDALVRCGDAKTAAPLIEEGLAGARHKASWLLLRARLAQRGGDAAAARRDAAQAADELRSRIDPSTPNPLLAERLAVAERLASE